jgi:hypothetical protein
VLFKLLELLRTVHWPVPNLLERTLAGRNVHFHLQLRLLPVRDSVFSVSARVPNLLELTELFDVFHWILLHCFRQHW